MYYHFSLAVKEFFLIANRFPLHFRTIFLEKYLLESATSKSPTLNDKLYVIKT